MDDATRAQNAILANLPTGELSVIAPFLVSDQLHLGTTLDTAGEPITSLYFPLTAAISVVAMHDNHHMVDITVIGKEGCSGGSFVQGSDTAPFMTIVEIGGPAIRVTLSAVKDRLSKMPYLQAALALYNLLLLRHSAISVGCSQFHSAEQRLARWLKAHWHRTGIDSFPFSSDFLAAQAGINPKTADEVLTGFDKEGLIERTLRAIKITDQERLTTRCCPCFSQAKESTDDYVLNLANLARTFGSS
jgi:Crp-like helix-turn-helix protein